MRFNILTTATLLACGDQLIQQSGVVLEADPVIQRLYRELVSQHGALKQLSTVSAAEVAAEALEDTVPSLDGSRDHLVHAMGSAMEGATRRALARRPPLEARAEEITQLRAVVLPDGYSQTTKPAVPASAEGLLHVKNLTPRQWELAASIAIDDTTLAVLLRDYVEINEKIIRVSGASASAAAIEGESPSMKAAREEMLRILMRLERLLPEAHLSNTQQAKVLAPYVQEITAQERRLAARQKGGDTPPPAETEPLG